MERAITIGRTKVGDGYPCFITAEVGININSPEDKSQEESLRRGYALIEEAAQAGASGVKFQMFTAKRMYPKGAGQYTIASGKKVDIWNVIKENELVADWVPKLKKHSRKHGIECFVTTCDEDSTDELAKRSADVFKIASGELTYLPLLRHTARKKKPIILSTGGATIGEVAEAVETIEKEGNRMIAIMHCVMQYPADLDSLNLSAITTLRSAFPRAVIGWSDHSLPQSKAPETAVALGAKIIEKHFTLSRNLPGPDHSFALEPKDLKKMVEAIRTMEKKMKRKEKITLNKTLLGTSERTTYKKEKYFREFIYRSIFATRPIRRGEVLSSDNIMILRPGEFARGLDPKHYDVVLGRIATRDIRENAALTWDDVLI